MVDRLSIRALVVAILVALLAACSNDKGNKGDNQGGDNPCNPCGGAPQPVMVPTENSVDVDDAEGPIRIAVCGPMTGSGAAFGEMIRNAAKLKEQEVNAAGGIEVAGRTRLIEFVIYDDKGNTSEANNVSRSIASDDSITAVVGHFNSTCSNAAKQEYNDKGYLMLSPGSTNVAVCKGFPFVFRNLYRDDYQGDQIARYIKDVLGLGRAAVLFDNDDYGKGLKTSFVRRARRIGLQVVVESEFLRERTQDFKPLAQQVKDSGAEAVFVAGLYNEAGLIAKAVRGDLDLDIPVLGGDGVMSPGFIQVAGQHASGALISTPFLFNTGDDSEVATSFLTNFREAYNTDPDTWAALTWDACGMILWALEQVDTTNRAVLRNYMAQCTTEEKGYSGVTGVTYFDHEGDCYSKPVYMATVRDGQFVPAPQQFQR